MEKIYHTAMSLSILQHCKARQMPMAKDVLKELDVCLAFDIAARHKDREPQRHRTASHDIAWIRMATLHLYAPPRDLEDLLVLTEPLFEQDVDEGREQEVTREELLHPGSP